MILVIILIFIVLPFLLICALLGVFGSGRNSSFYRNYEDYSAEKDFYEHKNEEPHLPAKRDRYGNYSDDIYDMALDMGPEDLREEDPDLYDEIYGYEANNPDEF